MQAILKLIFCIAILMAISATASAMADEPAQESQGAYIARLGDCVSCHTAPGGKPYAGGLPVNSPFGAIYSTNITPDKEFGIGNYTLEDFSRALRHGIAKDGHHLYPAMPYTSFAGASDDDIKSLYEYFMQVIPVNQKPPPTKLPFPFNQRWGMAVWNLLFLHNKIFTPDPSHDAEWNRGEYMLTTFAHCSACHTPRGPAYEERGGPDSSIFLTGMVLDHWYAPNLRQDPLTGLGKWSEDNIAEFLKTGHGAGVVAFGNMAQAVQNSTQYLTDDDRQALAHYLITLADHKHDSSNAPTVSSIENEKPGAGLYASSCAGCHQADGSGRPPRYPKLAGNPAILAKDSTSVIRIVLAGGFSAAIENSPPPGKMPAFAPRFTDQEVADVVTYIRQSWGNRAPSVTAGEVAIIRKVLKQETVKSAATSSTPSL